MVRIIRKPRDWSQRALSVVQQATGQIPKIAKPVKNLSAAERGRLGGRKGGKIRKWRLSAKRRIAIAKKAARARWG